MTVIWTSEDAARATGGEATAAFEVTGLSIDTRSIATGDMFVALKDRRDGHDFVADAFAAGATAALVTHRPEGVAEDAPLLIVADVMEALEALAQAARARTQARVVGVTGSVGKTSTKDMLRHVLARQGAVHAAERSFNNHWGVPLTLARMPADTNFAVIEIGMNHPGEIAPLARLAELDVAMVTSVAAVHLEAFEDGVIGIAREKASIFDGLVPGGTAVINGDLETTSVLVEAAQTEGARVRRFTTSGQGTDLLLQTKYSGGRLWAEAQIAGKALDFDIPTAGRHFAANAVAVLGVVDALGGDIVHAARDLADWVPPSGRGTSEDVKLPQGTIRLLDDAYNANPTSMGAAFEALRLIRPAPGGRRVAILGDMLELGPTGPELHGALAEHPAFDKPAPVFTVGPLMQALHDALPEDRRGSHHDTAEDAVESILAELRAGDVVLVKGSLGMQMARIIKALRDAAN